MAGVCETKSSFSDYYNTLEAKFKDRYRQKISLCDSVDPYCLGKVDVSYDYNVFPSVTFRDISTYLIHTTSYYSNSEMKSYKSMDAYNFFVCGWVKDLGTKLLKNGCRLVFARVNHSQRSTETPLRTWIVFKENGEVVTAHCNCMAGLAESCSHVGAVLYAVETAVRMRDSSTCTMEKCKWLMPSHINKIPPAPVAKIDFCSASKKKKKLDDAIDIDTSPETSKQPQSSCAPVTKDSDVYKAFFEELNKNYPKSAALMTQQKYHQTFVPKSVLGILPKPLLEYRTSKSLSLSVSDLEDECARLILEELTPTLISAVERETRKQSGSKIWFRQRAGRITASKLKQCLQTDVNNPSKSVIRSICYPEIYKFSTSATRYGCVHEAKARKDYEAMLMESHEHVSVSHSGLWLKSKLPYMGATPDGIVVCSCHGTGACEIKCPFCYQEKENNATVAGKRGFCLVRDSNDEVNLDKSHAYFYQVQAQIHILDIPFCDFVVWNKNSLFVQRVLPDVEFWNNVIPKAERFFRNAVLPEILGKKFTKQLPCLSVRFAKNA